MQQMNILYKPRQKEKNKQYSIINNNNLYAIKETTTDPVIFKGTYKECEDQLKFCSVIRLY